MTRFAHTMNGCLAMAGLLSLAGCMITTGGDGGSGGVDTAPPAAPIVERVDPPPPSNVSTPRVYGRADLGTRVRIYASASCEGTALGEGTAEVFARTGIEIAIPRNQKSTLFAVSIDLHGQSSACSRGGVDFTHDDIPPTFDGQLTATSVSPTTITVAWTPASDSATPSADIRYELCVTPSASAADCKPFTASQSPGAGTTFWNVGGLREDGTYTVVVRAVDAAGNATEHPVRSTVRMQPARANGLGAGAYHTCALQPDGTVKCWGWNFFGQLGAGSSDERSPRPVSVPGLQGVVTLAAGGLHTCAILGDRSVRCFGDDAHGQLGGSSLGAAANEAGKAVAGLGKVVSLAAGLAHTCALADDGTVRCWGENARGQLGDGTTKSSATPVAVRELTGAVSVAAGDHHACALLQSGEVRCWGGNVAGELGATDMADHAAPVKVAVDRVVALVTGWGHTCALRDDGSARCFGQDGDGQLGDGPELGAGIAKVDGLSGATAIAAGWNHTCARLREGDLACWGRNADGQLGDGSTLDANKPTKTQGLRGVVALSGGESHTCALLETSEVRCFGRNDFGQLGDGTLRGREVPTPVAP